MRVEGSIVKVGKWCAVEIPAMNVHTQGKNMKEAYLMAADAVESLVGKEGFRAVVFPGKAGYFELGSNDEAAFFALLLKRMREKANLSLSDVQKRLGARSINTYARYEQGSSVPTVSMFARLVKAMAVKSDIIIGECRA
jgi:hypothetical protein